MKSGRRVRKNKYGTYRAPRTSICKVSELGRAARGFVARKAESTVKATPVPKDYGKLGVFELTAGLHTDESDASRGERRQSPRSAKAPLVGRA